MKKYLVGVFDSGIGGLTVLSECVRRLPDCDYLYFGDNAHAPYGSRSPEEITSLVRTALRVFDAYGADAAVLACNTATAVCARAMREEFSFPVVGTEPAVKPAAFRCAQALVLATPRTVRSERLRRLVGRFPQCSFTLFAPVGLAGAIERAEGQAGAIDLKEHLPRGKYDGVVLGCTHYIYLRKEISAFYRAPVFDGNRGTAERLAAVLGVAAAREEEAISSGAASGARFPEREGIGAFFAGETGIVGGGLGKTGTADHRAQAEEKTVAFCSETGMTDHRLQKTGTADHKRGSEGADLPAERQEKNGENKNKCFYKIGKNGKKSDKKWQKTSIFYLGSGKNLNKRLYEQMFANKQ